MPTKGLPAPTVWNPVWADIPLKELGALLERHALTLMRYPALNFTPATNGHRWLVDLALNAPRVREELHILMHTDPAMSFVLEDIS